MFNAFETLNLPLAFDLDENVLEKAYIACIQETHPDQNVSLVAMDERKKNLQQAAGINEAYRLLKDPALRAHHLLDLEYQDVTIKNYISPNILSESIELREILLEAMDQEGTQFLIHDVQNKIQETLANLKIAFKDNDKDLKIKNAHHLTYLNKFKQESLAKLWSMDEKIS